MHHCTNIGYNDYKLINMYMIMGALLKYLLVAKGYISLRRIDLDLFDFVYLMF